MPREEMSEEERRARERVYNRAVQAQSIPPRGLGDLLKATPERRREVREEWRRRPGRERVAIWGSLAWSVAVVLVLGIGLFSESSSLILGAVLAGAGSMLLMTVVLVVDGVRRRS